MVNLREEEDGGDDEGVRSLMHGNEGDEATDIFLFVIVGIEMRVLCGGRGREDCDSVMVSKRKVLWITSGQVCEHSHAFGLAIKLVDFVGSTRKMIKSERIFVCSDIHI